MRIGYLQLGPREHGIRRYGKLLAAEGRRRLDITITEASVNLTNNRKTNREMLIVAARQLSATDVIHIQYSGKNNQSLWGNRWEQLYHLWIFKYHCSRPIVVTLHDIYEPTLTIKTGLQTIYKHLKKSAGVDENKATPAINNSLVSKGSFLQQTIDVVKRMYGANALSFFWLLNQAKLVFVSSGEESRRLQSVIDVNKIKVVPHFVEKRDFACDRSEAKSKLKLNEGKIITILGFIHGRKGYQLIVETMPQLPQNVKVVFAGGSSPGDEEFVAGLIQLAKSTGVDDRLRITGYLSEEELEQYITATDLAICPFKFFSASGSLSTWISAARPILAYDLPQITEYNSIEPGSIKTFQPYESRALAKAITQLLVTKPNDDPAVSRLREKLSISTIFDKQLDYYRQVTKKSFYLSSKPKIKNINL